MNNDLNRIKQDLKTIETAIGATPEFDRRHVWVGMAWGIWGLFFIAFGFVPHTVVPPIFLALVLIALLFLLPTMLPRLACPDLPALPFSSMGSREINSGSVGLLILALSAGIIFWVSRLHPAPHNLVYSMVFFMTAAWSLFTAWGRPWLRSLFAFAAAFGVAGFVMPFVSGHFVGLVIGAAMIVGGFGGAAILQLQLKASAAHGKAAH